jgi:hypothetical protein
VLESARALESVAECYQLLLHALLLEGQQARPVLGLLLLARRRHDLVLCQLAEAALAFDGGEGQLALLSESNGYGVRE